jgi:hypothetical protein
MTKHVKEAGRFRFWIVTMIGGAQISALGYTAGRYTSIGLLPAEALLDADVRVAALLRSRWGHPGRRSIGLLRATRPGYERPVLRCPRHAQVRQ